MSIPKESERDRDRGDHPSPGLHSPNDPDRPRRKVRRLLLSLGLLLFCLYIYTLWKVLILLNINNHLPAGITMLTPLERGVLWRRLITLGAYAKGGKIYDSSGKEIIFHRIEVGGPPPPRGEKEEEVRKRREVEKKKTEDLERRYRVIYLRPIFMP